MENEKFQNLRTLILDMKKQNRFIQVFVFIYKNIEYVGIIKRFLLKDEMKPYEFSLEFMKGEELIESIRCIITYRSLIIKNFKEFKEFFDVDISHGGDFIKKFEVILGRSIPLEFKSPISERHQKAAIRILNISDSQDPTKIFCCDTMIHSEKERSEYNSEKTMILEPILYEKLKDDKKVSFCYSSVKDDRKSPKDIIKRYEEKIKSKGR